MNIEQVKEDFETSMKKSIHGSRIAGGEWMYKQLT